MSDLAEWLLEQIADDELAARYYPQHAHPSPARVLAECEAKRRIVEEVRPDYYELAYPEDELLHPVFNRVLRFLALPYADRPGYLEGWRP